MLSQENRVLSIATPLPDDTLVLHKAEIHEELGNPFFIKAEMFSENGNISLEDILGQTVTISVETSEDDVRYFNGFITQFNQLSNEGKYCRYSASIYPWFWLLKLSSNCRIFQNISYPDILAQVFNDLNYVDFELHFSGDYPEQEYVVQFNESDFDFVSRIMQQEGIFYYFVHLADKHTMVLVDDNFSLPDIGSYVYNPFEDNLQGNSLTVQNWETFKNVKSGRMSLTDFDFEVPAKNLESVSSDPQTNVFSSMEKFSYPGRYKEHKNGVHVSRLLMERENVSYDTKAAQSNSSTLFVGAVFTLSEHYREDQNQSYLITKLAYTIQSEDYSTKQNLDDGEVCKCCFSVIQSETPFRPVPILTKPTMTGPQTAIVVGPAGEEIWTDKYGRIKVQFHWDRYAQGDENSSCWIRVSHLGAGKGWGQMHIPRIGQEVLVDFLGGDPDQPIVIGSIYNGVNMPPYDLPANATQTGIKSHSSKGATSSNFNELRFEDKKGREEVYLQAEKDQVTLVKNNRSQNVGNDHQESIGNNKSLNIGSNHTESIGKNMTINVGDCLSETVANNYMENVGKAMAMNVGQIQSINVGFTQTIIVGMNQVLNVVKDQNIDIGKTQTVSVGSDQSLKVAKKRDVTIGDDDSLKVAKNLIIDVGDAITIKCGKASISMKKDGTVIIKGKDLKLDASGKTDIKASKNVVIKAKKVLAN